MTIWDLIGGLGVVFTSAQLLPQVIQSFRTRQVRDLSLGLGVIVLLSAGCWTLYGLHLQDVPIIIANSLNVICASLLIWIKLIGSQSRPHTPSNKKSCNTITSDT